VSPSPSTVFALPPRMAAKADPALVAADEQHLAALAASLERQVRTLDDRLAERRRAAARSGQSALERDQDVHRLTARLRLLRRFGIDLCLGRMVREDDPEPVYVGRIGLRDEDGRQLLVDWRAPAAEPFFAATPADPRGLVSRRRYRWTDGRVSDYWDEALTTEALEDGRHGNAALDAQSAFIASLAGARSSRMRDVLGTIQADQDAIVRSGSQGVLVVDGGPGTGKTVVALHRAAYLLHADPLVGRRRGGVLVVGPHRPYLDYVSDVLPDLGEDNVRTCTLRDLVPEGPAAVAETDPQVARLKASAAMVDAVEPAIRFYEEPPAEPLDLETPWGDVRVTAADWLEAFDAPEPGTPHNEARDDVREALVSLLLERLGDDEETPRDELREALSCHEDLAAALDRAWPSLDAADVLADLWSVPAYLRLCAPWFAPEERRVLRRAPGQPWTVPDLPLLDAARRRLGDPDLLRRRRESRAVAVAERDYRADVADYLVSTDDSEMALMSMLRGADLQDALDDEGTDGPAGATDPLAGPFSHVVVDEAQELTDAEWRMLLARCPSRSLTVVGDRAQARHGFTETWQERLARVGLDRVTVAPLTLSYRTPREVMVEAERAVREALPDTNVPTAVRSTGVPVVHAGTARLRATLDEWLATHDDGVACVVAPPSLVTGLADGLRGLPRVRVLSPETVKGLEFDLVVLLDPEALGGGVEGSVDRYVAMTRATERLVVLSDDGPGDARDA